MTLDLKKTFGLNLDSSQALSQGLLAARAGLDLGALLALKLAYSGLSDGLESGAGNFVNTYGSLAGLIVSKFNPVAGAAVTVGSGIVGGGLNRLFGSSTNLAELSKAKNYISTYSNFNSTASSFDDVSGIPTMLKFGRIFRGGLLNKGKANRQLAEYDKKANNAFAWAGNAVSNNVNNLISDLMGNLLVKKFPYGGELDFPIDTAIGYSLYMDKLVSKNKNTSLDIPNIFANGSVLGTNGAAFSDGLITVNAGGTHEENPNGGTQMGTDSQGVPNLLEEGEAVYKDYVFSKRLVVPESTSDEYVDKVLKPYVGMPFADAAKKAERLTGADERPNGPIEKRGLDTILGVLTLVLEKERMKDNARQTLEALDNMSPEEFAMLQLYQQQMLQQEGPTMAALGGLLENHIFRKGGYKGTKAQFINDLRQYGLDESAYLRWQDSEWDDEGKQHALDYLNYLESTKKALLRRYKLQGYSTKSGNDYTDKLFWSDFRKALSSEDGANNTELAVNRYRSTTSGKKKVGEFNNYAYNTAVRDEIINAPGTRIITPNELGKLPVNYGIQNPTGLEYIKDMPTYKDGKWYTKDNLEVSPYVDEWLHKYPDVPEDEEYTGPRYFRFREVDSNGNPTGKYVKSNSSILFDNDDYVDEGDVRTFNVKQQTLSPYITRLPSGEIVELSPEFGSRFATTNGVGYPEFEATLNGYVNNPIYVDITKTSDGKDAYKEVEDIEGEFPKLPTYPFLAGLGVNAAATLYNALKPIDYSNSDALLRAAYNSGNYMPIYADTTGDYLPYEPVDLNWEGNKVLGQMTNERELLKGLSGGNRGLAMAGILSSDLNLLSQLGDIDIKAALANRAHRKDVVEHNSNVNIANRDARLKADMANLDAYSRAAAASLEGQRAAYAMRLKLEDDKAASINAGLSGIANALYGIADTNYKNALLGWSLPRNYGSYIGYTGETAPRSKGGKIRKKKGLGF